MKASDFICKVSGERIPLDLGNGIKLEVQDGSDHSVRYRCVASGAGDIYYEINRYRQDVYVAIQDDRGHIDRGSALRRKMKEIADKHGEILGTEGRLDRGRYAIRHKSRGKPTKIHCYRRFDDIMQDIEDVMRDLYELYDPLFKIVLPAMEKSEGEGVAAIDAFVVPSVLTSREMILHLRQQAIPFGMSNDKSLDVLSMEGGWNDGNDEYVQYGTMHFDGNVHYEICRGYRNALTVELHDERSVSDADLLRLHIHALQKRLCRDLVYDNDWCEFGIAVRCSDTIICCREPSAILHDLEGKMRKLHDTFDVLLCEAERVGIDNLTPLEEGCMALPEMRDPEPVTYTHEVVDPKSDDIDKQSLFWVPTISELFGRQAIPLPDGRRMIPGQYIIPEYQRKYAWTSRQVSQLCRDLLRHAKQFEKRQTPPSYHLGTIILQSDEKSDAFYVVDGQQRLRTISRLLGRKFFQKETARLPIDCKFSPKDELTIYGALTEFSKEDRKRILDTLLNATVVCISVKDVSEAFQLFSTQNGRGKPLSAPNLLKAYHLHELERSKMFLEGHDDDVKKVREELACVYDKKWEASNAAYTDHDGKLLAQVLGEHLYRIRRWCRGEFPKIPFSGKQVDEFKGITLQEDASQDIGEQSVPLQNLSVLRKLFGRAQVADPTSKIEARSSGDGLNAFVAIDQPIVNGEDFFDYALTYAGAYKNLFTAAGSEIAGLTDFRKFYETHCLYDGFTRRGDGYARHVFESLCLFCYDRFGERGLTECQNELYRCAYFERATKSRCYYVTCGSAYAVGAVRCMLASATIVALKDRLHELCREMKENFRDELNCGNVLSGLKVVRKVFNTFEDENDVR